MTISPQAQAKADNTGSSDAGWNAAPPGRTTISTPASPTSVAVQRRQPTFSPSSGIDSAVTKSGVTKLVATASAIGRYFSDITNRIEAVATQSPRRNCSTGRCVRSRAAPPAAPDQQQHDHDEGDSSAAR